MTTGTGRTSWSWILNRFLPNGASSSSGADRPPVWIMAVSVFKNGAFVAAKTSAGSKRTWIEVESGTLSTYFQYLPCLLARPKMLQPSGIFYRVKEHCLMGIKGTVRRSTDGDFIHANIDIDLLIDEEREVGNSEKPHELFDIVERFCLGRRRLVRTHFKSTCENGPQNAFITLATAALCVSLINGFILMVLKQIQMSKSAQTSLEWTRFFERSLTWPHT